MDSLLEQLDERIRRVVAEALASREEKAAPSGAASLDAQTERIIREQVLIASKTYLTRAETAKYLGVSERSIAEWSARPTDQNPFPAAYAGGEPRYKRAAVDDWTVAEGRRQRLKLAG
ncbi:MAG: helix-turn-helix domain-containing protein [Pyrinomonadaceae bacterium]